MKLKWEGGKVTTPAAIESHNNLVETLWRWRHAGLVVESEQNEKLPELINTPKRIVKCECGNDDLKKFTLINMAETQLYSLDAYGADGKVWASYADGGDMRMEWGLRFGLARTYTGEDGEERHEWLWLLVCDSCQEQTDVWGRDLKKFLDFC